MGAIRKSKVVHGNHPTRLTEFVLDTLDWVYKFGPISLQDLGRIMRHKYPYNGKNYAQYFSNRQSLVFNAHGIGLVNRPQFQIYDILVGKKSVVQTLSNYGAEALRQKRNQIIKKDDWDDIKLREDAPQNWKHDTLASMTFARLIEAVNGSDYELGFVWDLLPSDDGIYHQKYKPVIFETSQGKLIPDQFTMLYGERGKKFFAWEIDRNTEPNSRTKRNGNSLRGKFEKYAETVARGLHTDIFGVNYLRVPVVTTSHQHILLLLDLLESMDVPRSMFMFTTFEDVRENEMLTLKWINGERKLVTLTD